MKKVLISTVLVTALGLSFIGCGSSSNSSNSNSTTETEKDDIKVSSYTPSYLNIPAIPDQNITLAGKDGYILWFKSNGDISYNITGGDGKDLFKLENDKLYFIGNNAGSYTIELKAHDNTKNLNGAARALNINVVDENAMPVVDTTAPVFNITTTSVEAGKTIQLLATDDSSVRFDLTQSQPIGFKLSGSTLTAPAVTGDYNITVVATDSSENSTEVNATITVTDIPAPAGGTLTIADFDQIAEDDSRKTQEEAAAACEALGKRLPTFAELNANVTNATIANIADFDSDGDSSILPNTFASVIWSSDIADGSAVGLWFKYDNETNTTTPQSLDTNPLETYFYTCVPK